MPLQQGPTLSGTYAQLLTRAGMAAGDQFIVVTTGPKGTRRVPMIYGTLLGALLWYPLVNAINPGPECIVLSDSIAAQGNGTGWFEAMCGQSGGRLKRLRNAGVAGNKSTDMLARFQADVADYQPDRVFIAEAVNDAFGGVTVAQNVANFKAMIQWTWAIGATPYIVASPTYDSNPGAVRPYNLAQQRLAAAWGVSYFDPWRTCLKSDGTWKDSTYTDDGTHPTPMAARLAGADALTKVGQPVYSPMLPWSNTDAAGKLSNCLFVTNTVAGTPNGWTIGSGLVSSLAAVAGDVLGNWFTLTFAAISAAVSVSGPNMNMTGITAGDRLRMVLRVKTSGFEANGRSGLTGSPSSGKVQCQIYLYLSTGATVSFLPTIWYDMPDSVYETEFVMPAGVTGFQPIILITPVGGGSVSGVLSIAQMQVYNLSTMPA